MNDSSETTHTKHQSNNLKIISIVALGLASCSLLLTAGTAFAESQHHPGHSVYNMKHTEGVNPKVTNEEKDMENSKEQHRLHEDKNKMSDNMLHGEHKQKPVV